MATDIEPAILLHPGQSVPGWALPDADGGIVRLTSFRQRHPVLLAILHSATCPDCRQWLSGMAVVRDELVYHNAQPLLIFPDDPATLRGLRAELELPVGLLSDPHHEALSHYFRAQPSMGNLPVLLVAVDRYNTCLDAWLADEPSQWPMHTELMALFALAEQEDCACGLPIWSAD